MRMELEEDRLSLGRRGLFGALTTLGALAVSAQPAPASPVQPGAVDLRLHGRPLHVVDLAHELTTAFNLSPGRPRIAMQANEGSGAAVGMNLNLLSLVEHRGRRRRACRGRRASRARR